MVFSINKTDRHDITEILLKVAFNTKTVNPQSKIDGSMTKDGHIVMIITHMVI